MDVVPSFLDVAVEEDNLLKVSDEVQGIHTNDLKQFVNFESASLLGAGAKEYGTARKTSF